MRRAQGNASERVVVASRSARGGTLDAKRAGRQANGGGGGGGGGGKGGKRGTPRRKFILLGSNGQ
ncbi:unnamed protein product [Pylaiella littoralis]